MTTRVCCEQHCCDDGLFYDTVNALCLPDTCSDVEFKVAIPYRGVATASLMDVENMYDCCNRGSEVVLKRSWAESGSDSIELCPGKGVINEGNMYNFTLVNERTISFTCNEDDGLCKISGDGLLSDTFGKCHRGADCLSGNCDYGEYLAEGGFCVCGRTYGCEEDKVCLECGDFYEQSKGSPDAEDCDRPNHIIQANCYLKAGEACQKGADLCETGYCENGFCVCSPRTGYPCDADTEMCIDSTCQLSACRHKPYRIMQFEVGMPMMNLTDVVDMHDCCLEDGKVALLLEWHANDGIYVHKDGIDLCPGQGVAREGNKYLFTREDGTVVDFTCAEDTGSCTVSGDGMQARWCFRSDHCFSEVCTFASGDRSAGECMCNTETHAGCNDDSLCADQDIYYDITGESDAILANGNSCYLNVGEPCYWDRECFTHTCDSLPSPIWQATPEGACACAPYSNYPCDVDNGENCVLENGMHVCK